MVRSAVGVVRDICRTVAVSETPRLAAICCATADNVVAELIRRSSTSAKANAFTAVNCRERRNPATNRTPTMIQPGDDGENSTGAAMKRADTAPLKTKTVLYPTTLRIGAAL